MNEADKRKLFINYMENVNYLEDEKIVKKITASKLEKWILIVVFSCIILMTLWEILKEVIFKLRF